MLRRRKLFVAGLVVAMLAGACDIRILSEGESTQEALALEGAFDVLEQHQVTDLSIAGELPIDHLRKGCIRVRQVE